MTLVPYQYRIKVSLTADAKYIKSLIFSPVPPRDPVRPPRFVPRVQGPRPRHRHQAGAGADGVRGQGHAGTVPQGETSARHHFCKGREGNQPL